MSAKPDAKTDTCEVRWRNRLPNPEVLTRHFTEMHVGAEVRGVEASVDGSLEMHGTNFVLRVGGSGEVIELGPLSRKVQWNAQMKEPAPPSIAELGAFRSLIERHKTETNRIHITGPLVARNAALPAELLLEVRKYEVAK